MSRVFRPPDNVYRALTCESSSAASSLETLRMHICRTGPSRLHVEPQDDDISSLEPKTSPCMAQIHAVCPGKLAVLASANLCKQLDRASCYYGSSKLTAISGTLIEAQVQDLCPKLAVR